MNVKNNVILTLLLVLILQMRVFAQEQTIKGIVSDETGPLPGVSVLIKGTTQGTETDFDGNYIIKAKSGSVLQFSFVGMTTVEKVVGASNTINVLMQSENVLDEVVVTAQGISREKKSLGYATQEVKGESVATVKSGNVVNSLSGKVSGVQIRTNNNFGGSTNFLIRGVSSLTGNNQPLFVIDGVPISNNVNNTTSQAGGGTGYDYGNAASDINPDNIESVNILKGAAASAIYGSRGANGVVIITTKKGKSGNVAVTINSGVTIGSIDKSTFIKYQDKYGAGYAPYYGSTGYFDDLDVDGDGIKDLVVPTYEDASFGGALDGKLVYQWDAFVPEHRNYGKKTPYKAVKKTPVDFFETTLTTSNSIDFAGGGNLGTYRLGYNNFQTTGILPNSEQEKNSVNFNGVLNVTDKFKIGTSSNVIFQNTLGRNSTGYNDNLMTQFRQWWQVNVDVEEQRKVYEATGKNYSWNSNAAKGGNPLLPQYWDNPYWTRFENYQTDERTRFFGNIWASYDVKDWLNVTIKAASDVYDELREERRAVGSVANAFGVLRDEESSGYDKTNIKFEEYNYDLMLNFKKKIGEKLDLNGLLGANVRKEFYNRSHYSTAGGLKVKGLYSLANSVNSVPLPIETLRRKQVNGYYAQLSLGYDNLLYLDLTDRIDVSSALPEKNNTYNYYAASASVIFSKLIPAQWLNFGKLRIGYAEVGNDLPANNVYDTYDINNNFGKFPVFSTNNRKKNQDLKPERTKELELGLEMKAFENRIGLDFTLYKKNTEDQLMPVEVSPTTGYSSVWLNAGEIENKGFEIGLNLIPLKTNSFSWSINTNFSKNVNKVISLFEDSKNLRLASFGGGVSSNATLGQPYGTLKGTNYVYKNGQRVVDSKGYYKVKTDEVIGNQNPDWNAGITNTLKYKDLSLSFLIDVQKGGDVYSLDMHYGQGTGLAQHTTGINDLGNPIRNPLSQGGGVVLEGVKEDGTPNDIRASASTYGNVFYWGNDKRNPAALTVYDASYVKLRELSLNYNFPKKILPKVITEAKLSLVGNNLWIIHKNVPFADPESGLGAGNSQGFLSGSYPTVRTYGMNLKLKF